MNEKHIYILEKVRKLNGKMSMIYVDFALGEKIGETPDTLINDLIRKGLLLYKNNRDEKNYKEYIKLTLEGYKFLSNI